MNTTIVWLVILVVLVAVELATMGLTTIWFAAGSLVATIVSALGGPFYLQLAFFFGVSIILLYFTRPVAVKYFNKDRIKTNAESLVGRQAVVTQEINNLLAAGQVSVGGNEWTARSMDDSVVLPVGSVVNILSIHGVKLIVEERKGGV